MRTRRLGSNGPDISVIGFGAWEAGGMAWGPNPPDDQTISAMQTAIDRGMTWIDTAEVYGGGRSEELVAKALSGRDDVLVFTKVAPKPAARVSTATVCVGRRRRACSGSGATTSTSTSCTGRRSTSRSRRRGRRWRVSPKKE